MYMYSRQKFCNGFVQDPFQNVAPVHKLGLWKQSLHLKITNHCGLARKLHTLISGQETGIAVLLWGAHQHVGVHVTHSPGIGHRGEQRG